MRIFALETDIEKLTASIVPRGDTVMMIVRFHWVLFFTKFLRALAFTAILAVVGGLMVQWGLSFSAVFGGVVILWIVFIILPLLSAYIDWRYDILILTNSELIVVNQSSIIRRTIREMNLDNIATVNSHTQFLNLFNFGRICFALKEGTGAELCMRFIPHVNDVSTRIGRALTEYQQGVLAQATAAPPPAPPAVAAAANPPAL